MSRLAVLCGALVWLGVGQTGLAAADLTFTGACDASAAIRSAKGLAVANDEDDVIRPYVLSGNQPQASAGVSLEDHLAQEKPRKEADLEGAAAVGDRVYWIASHGRDSKGKPEVERQVLFATDLELKPLGSAYKSLLNSLLKQDKDWKVGLGKPIGEIGKADPSLAPEREGLNIEGLGYLPAAPDGSRAASLLIGLRNPRDPDDQALVIPVLNAEELVIGKAEPRLGKPIPLQLDGLGIRDLAWSDAADAMLIVAGTQNDTPDFRLFSWSGKEEERPKLLDRIDELNPEAVVAWDAQRVLLLSDDGDRLVPSSEAECEDGYTSGTCPCKRLKDEHLKSFRGRFVRVE
jgi:hypothetical protein